MRGHRISCAAYCIHCDAKLTDRTIVTHNPLALPPSLYADTAVPTVPTPPLDVDRTVSVAIIGGGFAGLSTALHLAERGIDAIVLEAQEPGWGASGNNGGQLNPGLKLDPDTIEATFGADLGRRIIAFAYDTPTFTLDLIRRLGIACEARQNGTLRAAYREANAAAVEATAEQCLRRGMPVSVLDQSAVREATGTDRYVRAMLDRRGGDLQPLSYARGLVRAAIVAGAAIHGQTPATSLRREGGRWRIETPRAVVRAEKSHDRAGVQFYRSYRAAARRRRATYHANPIGALRKRSYHCLLSCRCGKPLADGWPRSDAMDQGSISGCLSHALRCPTLAGASRRALDTRLEQPPRHDRRSLPPCTRTGFRRADLSRLQWPWRRARDRHGKAIGETAN
jgi:hypothetical protein